MKGSHTVEGFMNWLDNNENVDLITKINFKKHLKQMADQVSATGKDGEVKIYSKKKHVASIRVFDDGSCSLGIDPDMLKNAQFVPPPEKEL